MSFFNISKLTSKNKVKRPNTPTPRPLFLSSPFVHSSLVKGSFKPIVALPKYVDENEWLAVNVFDFFNYLNLFYGSISDFCTMRDCSTMSAGPGVEYTWVDSQKKSVKLPAPQYIDYVMSWIQNMLNDENVFPTKAGREFPRDFSLTIRMITKQLFRVFAHMFHCHYEPLLHLCAEGHFQSLFGHFMTFAKEFDLLDKKEIQPLAELICEMENSGTIG
ncbi:Mob1/phocein [Basidiobolus meristosporus CBS 931.73]|uniref:Mob1/phocein n=1 Tax=Basidiobolus meristosporus CBS 931.73 TaxID=1314790 RepID=A0A1Y1YN80_9FUNG|nr:Mob1/phocein [Basidiobolus meristosporus CBS 931.73]|eukprot:ORX99435.1 Mob1/phocein [Basidiobolus meristosporus CBS 931.73]